MKKYFISRHAGAAEWAKAQGVNCEVVTHFTADLLPCDVVGTLPINLVADVNAAGGTYDHLTMVVPADRRGTELTADDMTSFGAKLERFNVSR